MVNMRTMVGIDLVKSFDQLFFKFSTVTSPALLVPPALKSEKKEILNNFFYFYRGAGHKNYSEYIKIKASKSGLRIFIT